MGIKRSHAELETKGLDASSLQEMVEIQAVKQPLAQQAKVDMQVDKTFVKGRTQRVFAKEKGGAPAIGWMTAWWQPYFQSGTSRRLRLQTLWCNLSHADENRMTSQVDGRAWATTMCTGMGISAQWETT